MSDASIVFISQRTLTMYPPGAGVRHLAARRHYHTRTRCGRVIWENDQRVSDLVPVRRDVAERITRLCQVCAP